MLSDLQDAFSAVSRMSIPPAWRGRRPCGGEGSPHPATAFAALDDGV